MPTYLFQCINCETTNTILKSITEKVDTPICETCGNRMQRVYNLNAIIFKGNGWANKE